MSLRFNHNTAQWDTAPDQKATRFRATHTYSAPMNVELTEQERGERFKQQRVNATVSHAKYAARCIANRILQGVSMTVHDVETQLATYLVPKPAREFATRMTLEIVAKKRSSR